MALLVTVEEVLASMGMNEALADELTPVITSAITKAQIRIESDLGIDLDRVSLSDMFLTDVDLYCGITPNGFIQLKLSRLFLDKDTDVLVACQDTLDGTVATLPSTDFMVNYVEGVVHVLSKYADKYVSVTYDAGFSGPDKCVAEVKQAILALTPSIFRASQVTTEASDAPKDDGSEKLSYSMISKFMRSKGFQFNPLFSREV